MTDPTGSEDQQHETAAPEARLGSPDLDEDALVEDISIDGMCGVY